MSKRSDLWRQAQVCMSLARATADPVLKQRYEVLALEFAEKLGGEQDLDITVPSLAPKPDSNDTSA